MTRYVLLYHRYLKESGWRRSAAVNAPVDKAGAPLAWYSYAALQFLEPRLHKQMEVFEFGAGHSTLWWASRVGFVCSVESDQAWIDRLRPRLPENTDVRHEPLGVDGSYCRSARARGRSFDIIVIDGFDRNDCAKACLEALKPNGVVIWDNADWVSLFAEGLDFLASEGFRRIDLGGLSPLNGFGVSTAILYRPGSNCLEI